MHASLTKQLQQQYELEQNNILAYEISEVEKVEIRRLSQNNKKISMENSTHLLGF